MSRATFNVPEILSLRGNIQVIGSYADENIKYPNDIDLQEYVTARSPNAAYQMMREMLIAVRKNPNLFLIDIKAGFNDVGNPRKWTYKEFVDGDPLEVQAIFYQKCIIKLDLLLVNEEGRFIEYSVNYYFEIESHAYRNPTTYYQFTDEELKHSLMLDIQKLLETGKFFKAIKRKYTLLKLFDHAATPKHQKEIKRLIDLMNSDIGKDYQKISKLSLISALIDNKTGTPTPTKALIIANLPPEMCVQVPLPKSITLKQISERVKVAQKLQEEKLREKILNNCGKK